MREKLTYLSEKTLKELKQGIPENIERYCSGDFLDLKEKGDWSIPLSSLEVDLDLLSNLDPRLKCPEAEIENSLAVWNALHKLTPALACEDRIWTRLSHIECLDYSRKRWTKGADDKNIIRDIRNHFFSPSLDSCRDDHSISRLWWNAKIAKDLCPNDQRNALKMLLKSADIRSNLVENPGAFSRNIVGSAIIRIMQNDAWVTDSESNFRGFMKVVNRLGGGILFEPKTGAKLDAFMVDCVSAARISVPNSGQ